MRRAGLALALLVAASACRSTPGPSHRPNRPNPTVTQAVPTSPAPARPCERYTLIGKVLTVKVLAHQRPEPSAPVVAGFRRVNDQGATQVFPLLDQIATGGGSVWYKALLPIRPNGSTGWIAGSALQLERSDYRLQVDLSRLRLDVYRLCDGVAAYRIGVGTQDTPTPRGTFFLNSLLRPPRGSVYGAYAYGLSGYSQVIRNWAGGGIVGIHGTNNPASIGKRASHGCIRLRNADIEALVRIVPLGTIVTIH